MDHIVKSYDAEFAELDRMALDMGALAERQLADAYTALEKRNVSLAEKAVLGDRAMDELEQQLQERAIYMIAKRQPMADDLRHVMTVLRLAGDLERIGDLAKNVAKRAMAVSRADAAWPPMSGLEHMVELASQQLSRALEAFRDRDAAKALAVWHEDASLDALYNAVFRELLTYMMEDPRNIGLCTHLLFGAKNIERIGDHATNIAESICYLVTGTAPPGEDRPKGDETSLSGMGERSG